MGLTSNNKLVKPSFSTFALKLRVLDVVFSRGCRDNATGFLDFG